MQASSQKALKILSILVIVFAVIGLVLSVIALVGGATVMWAGVEVTTLVSIVVMALALYFALDIKKTQAIQ